MQSVTVSVVSNY